MLACMECQVFICVVCGAGRCRLRTLELPLPPTFLGEEPKLCESSFFHGNVYTSVNIESAVNF